MESQLESLTAVPASYMTFDFAGKRCAESLHNSHMFLTAIWAIMLRYGIGNTNKLENRIFES